MEENSSITSKIMCYM